MRFVLMGHRGVGKSTLARRIHDLLGWHHFDLDDAIEHATGETCESIIAESESRFRSIENSTFAQWVARDDSNPTIMSVGGGFQGFVPGPIYIWIRRSAWVEVALAQRQQVWPELTHAEEHARMRSEREPRWADVAHIVVDIPRGRTLERSARDLATLLQWMSEVPTGWAAPKTWMVPDRPARLSRAIRDARVLGLAGIEVRSDLFDDIPEVDLPAICSLRTPSSDWLRRSNSHTIDIDIAFLPNVLASGVLGDLEPRELILSTHPDGVDASDVEQLARGIETLRHQHPEWEQVELKYAPSPRSPFEAGAGMAMMRPLIRRGHDVTYLPQGLRYGWLRPVLLHLMNRRNYLPVGVAARRHRDGTPDVGASWDLIDWLPHLVDPEPTGFDLLIGEPVDRSQGDLWHRRAAREAGEPFDYLKVNVARDELDAALALFEGIGVRGMSVTSPHKFAVLDLPGVVSGGNLDAANTLRRTDYGWEATDTDTIGMVGAIRELEAMSIRPGTIAVIGKGGVADAVARGIVASPGWNLALHVGAREGWPDEPGSYRVIINAAGHYGYEADGQPPEAQVWLDLHYTGTQVPPGDYLHVIGDAFFEYQAREQRGFWSREDDPTY